MTTATVRISDSDYNDMKELADFHGMSLADFMRETLVERVRDENDYQEATAILSQNNRRVSREEVLKRVLGE